MFGPSAPMSHQKKSPPAFTMAKASRLPPVGSVATGLCGASRAGTSSTSARTFAGWRTASAAADRAPADRPITITLSRPRWSSNAA